MSNLSSLSTIRIAQRLRTVQGGSIAMTADQAWELAQEGRKRLRKAHSALGEQLAVLEQQSCLSCPHLAEALKHVLAAIDAIRVTNYAAGKPNG